MLIIVLHLQKQQELCPYCDMIGLESAFDRKSKFSTTLVLANIDSVHAY